MDLRYPEQTCLGTLAQALGCIHSVANLTMKLGCPGLRSQNGLHSFWGQESTRLQTPQAMCPGPALLGACSETKRSEEIVSNGKWHEQDKHGSACARGVRARRKQVVLGKCGKLKLSQGDFVCLFSIFCFRDRASCRPVWPPTLYVA